MLSPFALLLAIISIINVAALPSEHCPPGIELATVTLSNLTYNSEVNYSTPAHLAVKDGNIVFNLSNNDANTAFQCMGTSMDYPVFFSSDQIFNCTAVTPTQPGWLSDFASFAFSLADTAIAVNMTWWKDKQVDCYKTSFDMEDQLKLDCVTENYQNANWTIGQTWSSTTVKCKPTTVVFGWPPGA
ncbi:hypothetical protein BT63DRAFT_421479 [Microthyrium microscopicum]|uniref:AA1-like domain-containing protein n=1 Tax=Microthyrium microscopicum TaxID=703497 RepID=A0A6A6UPD9_9PEZI|nr:hypothetical protein BT63DRAFT_421479 [Microthyrium microscopicum]